jgi:Xaa-Pro aminopeptidase
MTQLNRLRESMAKHDVATLLVTDLVNIAWLTGFTGSFARVLVTQDQCVFITDGRYKIQAAEQVQNAEIRTWSAPVEREQFFYEQVTSLGTKTLTFEATNLTVAVAESLGKKLVGIEFVPGPDLFGGLRMVKTPEEIAEIESACALTDHTFEHLLRLIQPGVRELDIELDMELYVRRQGAVMAFSPIVVSGANSARPHGKATEKALELGDFLTMDFGARVNGYNADLTRTVVVGKATDEHRRIYNAVLEAQLAAIQVIRPGVAACEADAAARAVLKKYDLEQYFTHGLGHGLGRLVHDTGSMGATSKDVFALNQVWTVEPGVYIDGFGGCRIEDDVVVTENGCRILNKSTKELLELPQV